MTDQQVLTIAELKQLTLAVFDGLERAGVDRVQIAQEQYWTVFPSDAFVVKKPELVMGDVADDLHDLRSEVEGPDGFASHGSFWHALLHLRGILGMLAARDLSGGLMNTREGTP